MMSTSDDSAGTSPNDDMPANIPAGGLQTSPHDPLCGPPWSYGRGGHCEGCDLIAKARGDEREQAAQRVEQGVLGPEGIIFGCPFCGDPWESEPSCEHWHVIERLAAAVRGES